MDHLENELFARLLHKYQEVLQDKSLPIAERAKFEKMRDSLADALLLDQYPPSPSRRTIIKALATGGLFGLFRGPDISRRAK